MWVPTVVLHVTKGGGLHNSPQVIVGGTTPVPTKEQPGGGIPMARQSLITRCGDRVVVVVVTVVVIGTAATVAVVVTRGA